MKLIKYLIHQIRLSLDPVYNEMFSHKRYFRKSHIKEINNLPIGQKI